ncbi:Fe(3+)-hydroxamate ABC transporter substrate-binding protein FhuD [Acerihabitans arboris]|uniref:Fe(3+)-hydroxamate ABC transporter substrate-binding protein FhuD n=2 Tax=Acerihabitans arboris TaxID=2691583 RepID=A0A845SM96_9GAMM|nr:Fe(3+)-hydroxamate ABC transporter substrate-binding protein FhuD [Acerihabitans arboris]
MQTHDAYRRRLLQAMAVLPWWLSQRAAAALVPDAARVIALEWRPAELLLALGVTPLAIADVPNYRRWVVAPALPPSVLDLGLRNEPNMEAMQRLRPSLILLSDGFGPAPDSVAPIAPTMTFRFSRQGDRPLAVARQDITSLAGRLGLPGRAALHFAAIERQLDHTRQRLASLASPLPPVLLFSFIDSRRIMVIGQNSLFQDVLDRVGVVNAWDGDENIWGSATVGLERLGQFRGVRAICFHRGEQDPLAEVAGSTLWRTLPFVRERQLRVMPAVWFFGATIAAMRFSQVLEQAMGPRA